MFTVESKSRLAKLLAEENITIEHCVVQTAAFNIKTRTLYCPIWKDMSGSLYDLLMGHEVGHALYTPEEGWHDAVCEKGRNFKSFLNVVEDARIEKKIKRKYPGIKKSFVEAYQNLLDRDFFGLGKESVNDRPLIDKINIYTKTEGAVNVQFDDVEKVLLDKVLSCETWSDVVSAANSLYEYSKTEERQRELAAPQINPDFGDVSEDDEYENDYDDEGLDSEESDEESEDESETEDETDKESETEDETDKDSEDEKEGAEGTYDYDDLDSEEENHNQFEPVCETDQVFRQKENELLDEKSKPYVYFELPKPNLANILTPAEIVHQRIDEFYKMYYNSIYSNKSQLLKDFRNKNEKYISLLVKEFEMKKSAKAYSKSKVSNTGDIDINKIYKYQVEDNLFKRITRIDKGKSHGLVLLLDKSGSMRYNMASSIEQILILSIFCRKVKIPFVVYGFGDSTEARNADYPETRTGHSFDQLPNHISFGNTYLREYLNSEMKNSQFTECVQTLLLLKKGFEISRYPSSESLYATPLDASMVAVAPLVTKFKTKNNLDIVNLVLVTDGDGDETRTYYNNEGHYERIHHHLKNMYLVDKKHKFQKKLVDHPSFWYSGNDGFRQTLFDWFKQVTGCKIFGFFISSDRTRSMKKDIVLKHVNEKGLSINEICGETQVKSQKVFDTVLQSEEVSRLCEILKKQKCLVSHLPGYEYFFIIAGGKSLGIDDGELEVSGNITVSKLKTAFTKLNKKKQVNRVIVAKFIQGIA